ncbi:rCG61630 [Rattus norvegicus]|uniref:RCG61630 n=1 Tax=Rattus norvegicus TaxID=10116 RepID=A6HBD8_RAT|nr:rCG61630 [Rattus norvegicus]
MHCTGHHVQDIGGIKSFFFFLT